MSGTSFFMQLTSVAIWARAFRLQLHRLSSGPCYTTDLFMKSFPMKIPLVFKRPAAANANVRKRPAHFDAALQAEGTAKRPAHAVHYTEVQQHTVNEITEWSVGDRLQAKSHLDDTKCCVRSCPRSAMSRRAKYCRDCFLSKASRSGLKSGGAVCGNAGGHGQKGNAGNINTRGKKGKYR